jgi:hypothetical protein
MPATTPPWCPCTVGSLAAVSVPWLQFPTINPSGDIVYATNWNEGTQPHIIVHTAPDLGDGFSVRLPDEEAPPVSFEDMGNIASGLAFDADGNLHYGISRSYYYNADGSEDPPYDSYFSYSHIWKRISSAWSSILGYDFDGVVDPGYYGTGDVPAHYKISNNGFIYSAFHDDILYVRFHYPEGAQGSNGHDEQVIIGLTTGVHHDILSANTTFGTSTYAHLMAHPDDGSIWSSAFNVTTSLRRYDDSGSVAQFTFRPMGAGNLGQSIAQPVPDPENFGHVLIAGRRPGDPSDRIWRIAPDGTPTASAALCFQATTSYSTWTPDMSRVLGTWGQGSGTGSGVISEWAENCNTFVPTPCSPPETPSGSSGGVWVGQRFGTGGGVATPNPPEGISRATVSPFVSYANGTTGPVRLSGTPSAELGVYPGSVQISEDDPDVGLCSDGSNAYYFYIRASQIQAAFITNLAFSLATGGVAAGNVELYLTVYEPDLTVITQVSTVDTGNIPLGVGVALPSPLDISAYDYVLVGLSLRNNSGANLTSQSSGTTPFEVQWIS